MFPEDVWIRDGQKGVLWQGYGPICVSGCDKLFASWFFSKSNCCSPFLTGSKEGCHFGSGDSVLIRFRRNCLVFKLKVHGSMENSRKTRVVRCNLQLADSFQWMCFLNCSLSFGNILDGEQHVVFLSYWSTWRSTNDLSGTPTDACGSQSGLCLGKYNHIFFPDAYAIACSWKQLLK